MRSGAAFLVLLCKKAEPGEKATITLFKYVTVDM